MRSHARCIDGEELRQRSKAPVLVTEEDLHGLEASEIDSKKSWAPPRTFMGVRPHPDPNEGS
jgi:hypothetical protein